MQELALEILQKLIVSLIVGLLLNWLRELPKIIQKVKDAARKWFTERLLVVLRWVLDYLSKDKENDRNASDGPAIILLVSEDGNSKSISLVLLYLV